mgnify:CR=1 FL=1
MAGGRPTSFKKEYIEQAYKLCLLGSTDKEMADFFEVAESTLNKWKLDYPLFSESLKKGKAYADANVADRLYQRAMGYQGTEVKTATHEGIITDSKEYVKDYAPDTTAAIFWLKNRQRNKWRDRQEHDVKAVEMTHEQWLESLE